MSAPKPICVYASSSDAAPAACQRVAEELGALMARRGHPLVYGAGRVGLMGTVARAVHAGGGHVIGVIPERLRTVELAYEGADELIITQTMRERKAIMESRAQAFIALPGGFGTLEELVEVLVLRQLGYHDKPIVVLDVDATYQGLFDFFARLQRDRFIKESHLRLFHTAQSAVDALDYIAAHHPGAVEGKWFDREAP